MQSNMSANEKVFDLIKIRERVGPEGKILLYSLFFGLAVAPALAFMVFSFLGTVPEGYTIMQFYRDVRRDLFDGVWIAWALVLLPYGLVQFARITRWAIRTAKSSSTSWGSPFPP